jgi:hypothetical protein
MESSANEIAEKLEPVRTAAKYEAENIGHAVSEPHYWSALVFKVVTPCVLP